jgi:NhaP-type Na+/H+ or K+/H+ antiporter
MIKTYGMSKRLTLLLLGSSVILLVPFLGNLFSEEVNWSGFDYLVAAILLGSASFVLDFVLTKAKNKQGRWAWGIVVVLALALVWVEVAVGVFGSPIAGS